MSRKAYRAVFISPHLDDAVFSCSGEIARLVREGPVLVVNLFTGYLGKVKNRGVVLGEERYGEERAAAAFLGFESCNVGELDASFRRKAYESLGNIFRPPVREDTGEYLSRLRQRVHDLLADVDYDRIYVPLAIGWHVDHELSFRLFEEWIGRGVLVHYEDAPYCLIPHATRLRLDQLGSYVRSEHDAGLSPAGDASAWLATSKAYAGTALMRNLEPWPLRWLAVPVVSAYLYRLMRLHRRRAGMPAGGWTLQSSVFPLAASDFARKLQAMALYRSQFREFFVDTADCTRLATDYGQQSVGEAVPMERYWTLTPAA